MSFELYDGFGYCADFNGHEYILKYPKMAFVRCSVEAQDAIRELLGYDKDNDTYVSFGKSHNLKNLIKIGEMLKTRLLDGTLTHILQNGKTEPIDWLEIYQVDDPSNKKFWTSY